MEFPPIPKTFDEAKNDIVSLLVVHADLFFLGLASICILGAVILGLIWLVLKAIHLNSD